MLSVGVRPSGGVPTADFDSHFCVPQSSRPPADHPVTIRDAAPAMAAGLCMGWWIATKFVASRRCPLGGGLRAGGPALSLLDGGTCRASPLRGWPRAGPPTLRSGLAQAKLAAFKIVAGVFIVDSGEQLSTRFCRRLPGPSRVRHPQDLGRRWWKRPWPNRRVLWRVADCRGRSARVCGRVGGP